MDVMNSHRDLSRHHSARLRGSQDVMLDQAKLKKLRLRIDCDDPLHTGMKKLKISGKDLGDLPPEIFQIDELEVLDLSPERESCLYYRLTHVPIGIGKLIHLKVLMLDTNELSDLPAEICLLTALERLSLSNNHLKYLPDAFSSLRLLRSLHLANNKFARIPPSVCELINLEFLDMCDNMLTEVPANISQLHRLESLLLAFNRLSEIPNSICELKELRVLWLAHNNLRRLPAGFGNLRHLDWGYRHTSSMVIDDNPMVHPPVDICKKGVEAISRYFATINVSDDGVAERGRSRLQTRSRARSRSQSRNASRSPTRQLIRSPSPEHRWDRDIRSRERRSMERYMNTSPSRNTSPERYCVQDGYTPRSTGRYTPVRY